MIGLLLLSVGVTNSVGRLASERTTVFNWPVERGYSPGALTNLFGGVCDTFILNNTVFVFCMLRGIRILYSCRLQSNLNLHLITGKCAGIAPA